jgi:uncharacterized protein
MKIGIMGSSGLIGSVLIPFLEHPGNKIVRLKREINGDELEGLDAIVNLAGASIACLWTTANKKKIFDSRVETTKNLFSHIRRMKNPPRTVINASAIGYYGNRGEASLDEKSGAGSGFLVDVVQAWENACRAPDGTRVVFARFGMVLSKKGGALAKMLPPFKLGLGGAFGNGNQFISWIAIQDALGAIYHILNDETLTGPVNVVSPNPVRNEEFTKALGTLLKRPTFFRIPAFMAKGLFGQMGEELFLSSTKVEPRRLLETGYPFLYPLLKDALQIQFNHTGPYGI